jgi:hypothetical protein
MGAGSDSLLFVFGVSVLQVLTAWSALIDELREAGDADVALGFVLHTVHAAE